MKASLDTRSGLLPDFVQRQSVLWRTEELQPGER